MVVGGVAGLAATIMTGHVKDVLSPPIRMLRRIMVVAAVVSGLGIFFFGVMRGNMLPLLLWAFIPLATVIATGLVLFLYAIPRRKRLAWPPYGPTSDQSKQGGASE